MTIREALEALERSPDAGAAVIVLRSEDGELSAAPVLAVALDEDSEDASLLIGAWSDEEEALEDATTTSDVRDTLREIGDEHSGWPLFAADTEDPESGGSLVGHSIDDELEVFAFLLGPKSAWEGD